MASRKVTVNLNARGTAALEAVMALKGETQTEVINRAVQLYALLEGHCAEDGRVLLEPKDGPATYLKMF